MPVSQEGDDAGLVAYRDGKVDEQALFPVEPASVRETAVLDFKVDMPNPVHVGLSGKVGMYAADAEILRVNLHLAVQGGGGDQFLGMEAKDVGFASLYVQAVHQEIVVEKL